MATNSVIILKLKKEDVGRTFKFDPERERLANWDFAGEDGQEMSEEVTIGKSKKYIAIYCHFNGFTDGVGDTLKRVYTDYERLRNLIIGGDCSFIEDESVRRYGNREYEVWQNIKPMQGRSVKNILEMCNMNAFLFEDGIWKFKGYLDKEFKEWD